MKLTKYEERDFLDVCALRFDGWKYSDDVGGRFGPEKLDSPALLDKMEKDREFCPEPLDNLWAFFALQRYLGKWGGEHLTVHSDEHMLFRLLFLHLYDVEIPERYVLRDIWYERWEWKYKPVRENLAAHVRRTLRRKGRGPKFDIDIDNPVVKAFRGRNNRPQGNFVSGEAEDWIPQLLTNWTKHRKIYSLSL